jgi:hypothetical protein
MGKILGGLVGTGREWEREFVSGGFHGGRQRSHAREGGHAVPFIGSEQCVGECGDLASKQAKGGRRGAGCGSTVCTAGGQCGGARRGCARRTTRGGARAPRRWGCVRPRERGLGIRGLAGARTLRAAGAPRGGGAARECGRDDAQDVACFYFMCPCLTAKISKILN